MAKNAKRRLLLPVLIGFGTVIMGLFLIWPAYLIRTHAERDFSTAREKLDPEKLRQWAMEMTLQHPPNPSVSSFAEIPKQEIPAEIQRMFRKPPDAIVQNRNPDIVELRFGGGFAHWFIAIGPTNFLWKSGGAFQSKEWVPGIYFIRE